MTHYAQNLKIKPYSQAGVQLNSFERIVVSSNVALPDTSLYDDDLRIAYRAEKRAVYSRFGLSLPWVLLLILLTVGIISGILLGKVQQGKTLKDEFSQLQNQYTSSEKERFLLAGELSLAKDSNFICYYASQQLGMKLALQEETILVSASDTGTSDLPGIHRSSSANLHP